MTRGLWLAPWRSPWVQLEISKWGQTLSYGLGLMIRSDYCRIWHLENLLKQPIFKFLPVFFFPILLLNKLCRWNAFCGIGLNQNWSCLLCFWDDGIVASYVNLVGLVVSLAMRIFKAKNQSSMTDTFPRILYQEFMSKHFFPQLLT